VGVVFLRTGHDLADYRMLDLALDKDRHGLLHLVRNHAPLKGAPYGLVLAQSFRRRLLTLYGLDAAELRLAQFKQFLLQIFCILCSQLCLSSWLIPNDG
jgi:hypothetical protein